MERLGSPKRNASPHTEPVHYWGPEGKDIYAQLKKRHHNGNLQISVMRKRSQSNRAGNISTFQDAQILTNELTH